jgi:hypothetical protein
VGDELTGPFRDARRLIPLDTMVPRTEGYAYAAKVWDLSIVQGPFSVAPCQTLTVTIRNCVHRCRRRRRRERFGRRRTRGGRRSTPRRRSSTGRRWLPLQRWTKLRIVTLPNSYGLGRGDRKGALNDHIPNFRGVRVHVSTGYNRVEGNRRASRNGELLSRTDRRFTIRNFFIALTPLAPHTPIWV